MNGGLRTTVTFSTEPEHLDEMWANTDLTEKTPYDWYSGHYDKVIQGFEDREPGYHAAMQKTLAYAIQYQEALNIKFIQTLHRMATQKVQKLDVKGGVFSDESTSLSLSYASQTAKREYRALSKELIEKNQVRIQISDHPAMVIHHHDQKVPTQAVQRFLSEHLSEIQQINATDSKDRSDWPLQQKEQTLMSICKLIQNLERLHPFPDANGRVFQTALFNHLLHKHGFPPALQDTPNSATFFSRKGYYQDTLYSMQKARIYHTLCTEDLAVAEQFFELTSNLATQNKLKDSTSEDKSSQLDGLKTQAYTESSSQNDGLKTQAHTESSSQNDGLKTPAHTKSFSQNDGLKIGMILLLSCIYSCATVYLTGLLATTSVAATAIVVATAAITVFPPVVLLLGFVAVSHCTRSNNASGLKSQTKPLTSNTIQVQTTAAPSMPTARANANSSPTATNFMRCASIL